MGKVNTGAGTAPSYRVNKCRYKNCAGFGKDMIGDTCTDCADRARKLRQKYKHMGCDVSGYTNLELLEAHQWKIGST